MSSVEVELKRGIDWEEIEFGFLGIKQRNFVGPKTQRLFCFWGKKENRGKNPKNPKGGALLGREAAPGGLGGGGKRPPNIGPPFWKKAGRPAWASRRKGKKGLGEIGTPRRGF